MNRYFNDIKDFEGYFISKNGKIYSKKSNKYIKHNNKYVTLVSNGKKYVRSISKLLRDTFDIKDDNLLDIEYNKNKYKKIKNFEKLYAIDRDGNVLSLTNGKIRATFNNPYGYKCIFLSKNGKQHNKLIHRLVYEAWKGNIPEDMTVYHKDENKRNNNIKNLQLLTKSEYVLNFHVENSKKKRTLKGFVEIKGYDNYYINCKGDVISFKYGDKHHKISQDRGSVALRKNGKRYHITVKYLLNKYFNQNNKLCNKKYKNA